MAERLERLRDRAHSQMLSILRFAEKITEDTTIAAIKTRLESLEAKYQTFNEMEIALFESLTYKPITTEVDEVYYKARELLVQACGRRERGDNVEKHVDLNATLGQFFDQQKTFYEGVNTSQHVRLPKINIEAFSGDYKHWASFHDLFKSTVHINPNISDVHKLQMLKGLLKGDAASLIRHFTITESNYSEAWEKLCNRYNKITPIVSSLVQTFMEQKPSMQSNGKELRRISETSDEIIRGLRVLGPEAETRDPWLIHIVLGKIDDETKQLWANESVGKDLPTFENLLTFLNKRCDALEICDATNRRPTKPTAKSFVLAHPNNMFECVICRQAHNIFKCPEFRNMNYEARIKIITDNNLCSNCLKRGHITSKCFSRSSCLICRKRHHTLIHPRHNEGQPMPTSHHISLDQPTDDRTSEEHNNSKTLDKISHTNKSTIDQTQATNSQNVKQVLHTHYASRTTVLPTALVYIKTHTGELQLYRALLDSGSQTSFVTESCAQSLGLKRSHTSVTVYGLASTPAGRTRGKINMTIHSRTDRSYALSITAHIIHNITDLLPTTPVKFNKLNVQLDLADPEFYSPNKIDVLLGADVFFEILNPAKHEVDGLPPLQSSKFGWLIAGACHKPASNLTILHVNMEPLIPVSNEDLHQELKRFWEVEEIASPPTSAAAIHECEIFYEQTTTRTENGQFVVKLPFKQSSQSLGSSYEAAYQRLLAMERKFLRDPEFFKSYKSFMNEYISLGHMTQMPAERVPVQNDKRFYLPHHAVVKPSSSTTKLRVVFDASCKTDTGVSLNDILHIGPNIQTDLSAILLRFRKHPIALVSDIEKMYRQIFVQVDDANFQLILWREDPRETVKVYKLNTVTYGTACAPYLAVKTLKKSSENATHQYPAATHVINNDFYIDDMLTGCNNIEEAILLKEQLCNILRGSGFNLRKWKSNSQEFLNSFSQHDVQNIPKLIEDDTSIKTLGIIWNAEHDTFSFKVQASCETIKWTKRKLLSTASRIYDPLGWLAPTIILFKMLLQKLWLLKLEWDSNLPINVNKLWQELYQTLPELEIIQIPRRLTTLSTPTQYQLHAFCDASEAAYGSVVYLRCINERGEVTVNIVNAKSKVAPIKQISLPRLELCGAVLLCKLIKFCIDSLSYRNIEVCAWTDSMIVLHWLSDVPRRWKSFIGNRTAAILETIPRDQWQHVDSKHNPADVITRGVKPQALSKLQLWWRGPQWLSEPELNWPKSNLKTVEVVGAPLEERSKYTNVFTGIVKENNIVPSLLATFSSWFKIRKIMVYILRFGKTSTRKQRTSRENNNITPAELNDAEIVILRNVQQSVFKTEWAILNTKSILSSKNQLSSLDPFIDTNGLLRVGGRLNKSALPYSTMHPVILPKDHIISELIVRDAHINHMHAGNTLTLSIIRNKYWMIGARYIIKRCIKSCIVCIRYRFHKNQQKMGDLPTARCTQSRPFQETGLDYAGPLYIKRTKRNNSPVEKAYVAVFVCLAVKAVHLEVVSGLDTDSFLAALKRFVSRRGCPQKIWCDNGSNFIGANRELQNFKQQIIQQSNNSLISEFLLQKGIFFQFNPPHAPHFGGLWESCVKSFKYHLKRVTNINLTFEEITTLIIQIEALLNSRPLCRLNDDPANLEVLTPAHFLVGDSLTLVPEPIFTHIPQTKLSRWQNIQQRVQGFWQRWHQDYLTSLQQRFKWKSTTEQFEVDDVVLIRKDNLYPSQWILGKVTAIHPGSDGITRVVTLKTPKNEVKRPANKLIKLPVKLKQ